MSVDLGSFGAVPGPPSAPPVPAARAARAAQPARRRPHPLAVAVAVLLVADGALLTDRAAASRATASDPARVAVAFLRAVGDGDGRAARSYLGMVPPGETRLTDADLRAQVGPAFVRLGDVRRSGDGAEVSVTYDLVGLPATSFLRLADDHGGPLGASRWRVVGGLPVLTVRARRAPEVDGRPASLVGGAAHVTMFPGLVSVDGDAVAVTGDAVDVQTPA